MPVSTRARTAIVAAAVLGIATRASAGAVVETIAVEIRDYAGVAPATLTAATEEASRVLRRAGIEVEWTLAPASAVVAGAVDTQRPEPLTVVMLAPRHAAPVRSRSVLGYAVLPADGSPGVQAGVRYGAALRQVHETMASLPQVLGYVIAHELGHLLLGSNDHAGWGVMAAQLSGAYFDKAARGALAFASDEAERLRAGIRSRRALARSLARVD
jgi:hypothetical protein